jgi:AbrB family looped-hinge helix DNA binding protein
MYEHRTRINENGRLVIPASYRKAMDIKPGDEVILRMEEDELHISNLRHALRRARKLVKQYVRADVNLTESLIKDRRKEAAGE